MKLLPLFLLSSICSVTLAADWPQWRGPTRDGTSPESDWSHEWSGGPKQAWKVSVGKGLSSIAILGDAAFTQGHSGGSNVVWCIDAGTGAVRWKFASVENLDANQFEGGPTSTLLAHGDRIYAAGRSGTVFCLDAKNGGMIWRCSLPELTGVNARNWGLNSSPLLADGRLIFNWGTAGVALNPGDGRQLWLTGTLECGYTSPVAGRWNGQDVLFVAGNDLVTVVNPTDGLMIWRRPFHVSFKASDPVVVGDAVYFGSQETGGMCVRFRGEQPEILWREQKLGTFTGGAVLVKGHLYGILTDRFEQGDLACLEPETGKVLWRREGFGWGTLLAAGDRLLAMSDQGELSVIRARPEKSEPLARAKILTGKCWAAPAFANSRFYARNAAGDLVCLDLRGGQAVKINSRQ